MDEFGQWLATARGKTQELIELKMSEKDVGVGPFPADLPCCTCKKEADSGPAEADRSASTIDREEVRKGAEHRKRKFASTA